MRSCSGLPHWEAPDKPSRTGEDPLPAGASTNGIEVLDPVGLPLSPECERLLQRVAYAPVVKPVSPWAREIYIEQDAYRRCLRWSTQLADHEAAPLCSVKGSKSGKSHAELVEEACNKQPQDKHMFARLRDHLQANVAAMKCSMAVHASQEAAVKLSDSGSSRLSDMRQAFTSFVADGVAAEYIRPEVLESAEYRQMLEHFDKASAESQLQRSCAAYASHAALCGTDAAARGVRSVVQHHRSETLRVVTNHKGSTDSPAQRLAQELPVVPSSLFGGRWQTSLNALGRRVERREQFEKLVSKTGASSGSLLTAGVKRQQPFHDQGGAGSASSKKKKTDHKKGGSSSRPKPQPSSSSKGKHKTPRGGRGDGGGKPQSGSARNQKGSGAKGGKGGKHD